MARPSQASFAGAEEEGDRAAPPGHAVAGYPRVYGDLARELCDFRPRPRVHHPDRRAHLESILATHDEFDLDENIWHVPAQRMKASVGHRVPLSGRARDIIARLPRIEGVAYVFPGGRLSTPLSSMAMLELLRGLRPGLTVHGFRSTFRDWAAEETDFPSEVVEMALAHSIESQVERAYRRGDLVPKRRALMEAWAAYCGSIDQSLSLISKEADNDFDYAPSQGT